MAEPIPSQKAPYTVEVEAGKRYFWCACGRSQSQPFCDGAHSDTGISPIVYSAKESRTVAFCGCRASGDKPFCDGTHGRI